MIGPFLNRGFWKQFDFISEVRPISQQAIMFGNGLSEIMLACRIGFIDLWPGRCEKYTRRIWISAAELIGIIGVREVTPGRNGINQAAIKENRAGIVPSRVIILPCKVNDALEERCHVSPGQGCASFCLLGLHDAATGLGNRCKPSL